MGIGNYGELWEIELWLFAPRPNPWESGIMGNYGESSYGYGRPAGTHGNRELWGIMGNPGVPPPSTIYKNSINVERTVF